MQAVESYRLWLEGPGFESRSPRIAQVRVRLATNTLPQTPHRAGALCTGYALFASGNLRQLCLKCGFVSCNIAYFMHSTSTEFFSQTNFKQSYWPCSATIKLLFSFVQANGYSRSNGKQQQGRLWDSESYDRFYMNILIFDMVHAFHYSVTWLLVEMSCFRWRIPSTGGKRHGSRYIQSWLVILLLHPSFLNLSLLCGSSLCVYSVFATFQGD